MIDDKKSRVLAAARSVFLRYGYKRVNMHDLAEAAGVSRPALYLLFKNKEEIFVSVFLAWIDETVADVEAAMATATTPEAKIRSAFEIWGVRPFAMAMASPEAQELVECRFEFAQPALKLGYATFEATITPLLAALAGKLPEKPGITPESLAHVLASAVRGFKQTATTPEELRRLIDGLLMLTFRSK